MAHGVPASRGLHPHPFPPVLARIARREFAHQADPFTSLGSDFPAPSIAPASPAVTPGFDVPQFESGSNIPHLVPPPFFDSPPMTPPPGLEGIPLLTEKDLRLPGASGSSVR